MCSGSKIAYSKIGALTRNKSMAKTTYRFCGFVKWLLPLSNIVIVDSFTKWLEIVKCKRPTSETVINYFAPIIHKI